MAAEAVMNVSACKVLLVATACLAGCGYGSSGPSNYERMVYAQENAASGLTAKGATVLKKRYPPGEAYNVDLSGATIDDDVLGHLGALGPVAELNLSGSNITDEQFGSVATREKLGHLYKLDISNTQISDKGLLEAAELGVLAEIKAKGSKVTPAGIEQFRKKHPKLPFGLTLKVET